MPTLDFAALQLSRYPLKHAKDLRAWDAADEYLAQFLTAEHHVLLLNDGFGALHCAAELVGLRAVTHLNDSWCSQKAISINQRQLPFVALNQSMTPEFDLVLAKIPKSLSLMQAQLQQLAVQLTKPVTVYFSGMQKHVSSGHLEIIKALCAEIEFLPTQRKARMYRATLQPATAINGVSRVDMPELCIQLQNVAGVFAEQKIDIGSRFFIEHFDQLPAASHVADVGCGNGLLALAYHRLHPTASLQLFDESLAAIESARLSFAHNSPAADVQIHHHDGLADVDAQFELILINPPFHQQNTVTTDIALSMFAQAKLCLTPTGEVWIVANRHLNYHQALRPWFKRVDCMAQNAKFVILRARL